MSNHILTPIGYIEIPEFQDKPLREMDDVQLVQKALKENKDFCISPSTYRHIEKRGLCRALQHLINPSVGISHLTLQYIEKLKS